MYMYMYMYSCPEIVVRHCSGPLCVRVVISTDILHIYTHAYIHTRTFIAMNHLEFERNTHIDE